MMTIKLTRRQFFRISALFGAGLYSAGKGDLNLTNAQDQLPEEDPFMYLELTGSVRQIHDPVIIKEGDTYYCFATHGGIYIRKSDDLLDWERPFPPSVFAPTNAPDWTQQLIPASNNDILAPDTVMRAKFWTQPEGRVVHCGSVGNTQFPMLDAWTSGSRVGTHCARPTQIPITGASSVEFCHFVCREKLPTL